MVEIVNLIKLLIDNKVDFDIRYVYGGAQLLLYDRISIICHRLSTGYRCGKLDLYDSLTDVEHTCLNGEEAFNMICDILINS